jgi:hypothetical protein
MRNSTTCIATVLLVLVFGPSALSQTKVQERTVIVNGHSGKAMIYEIDGESFIDLKALAQITNATLSFRGNEISLTIHFSEVDTLPGDAASRQHVQQGTESGANALSSNFMTAAIQDLALIKDWGTVLALAVKKGVPGDGSRLVIPRDKAAEGLRLAKVSVSTEGDRHAMQLLGNHFDNVKTWQENLVAARKSMSTANYSMSEDALNRDPAFQKLATCSEFLGTMLPNGTFSDNPACH